MNAAGHFTLVALDVDGTLLTSDHRISPATGAALRRIHDLGVTVMPVTSRGTVALHSVVSSFDVLRSAPFIAAQGAVVGHYDADGRLRITERHPAPLEPARQLVCRAAAEDLTVHWFARDHWFVSGWDDTVDAEAAAVGAKPIVRNLNILDLAPDKLMIIAPTADTRPLEELSRQLPTGLHANFSDERFLEITRDGIDKGWAVARYCRAHDIQADHVLAIGDGPNDLTLFAFAGMSAAPANAHPDVRAAATVVTADNDHDGVAEALETLVG